ncbi:MAG: CocE/NonD family hydrolase [Dehalococcoidia bacterium]
MTTNKKYPAINPLYVAVESNVEMTTRDGVVLRADVYHPTDGNKYPALVCRTPYQKLTPRYVETATDLASRGYCVVMQDFRGRYASDGEYEWMWRERTETHDTQDGYDTVEWVAKLEWCDGRVGTWGHSNASWAIWMMLDSQPPSLASTLASGISQNILDINFGIFETGRRLEWSYMMAADMRRRAEGTDGPTTPGEATKRWNEVERGKYIWWLPIGDIPSQVFSDLNPQVQEYHRNQNKEFQHFGDIHHKVQTPIYQITGWWDRLIGTIDHYEGLTKNGPEHLKDKHRLIIGPWGHDATDFTGKIGPVDYGLDAEATYAGLIARWYDYDLKGIDNGLGDEAPVQMWVLGEDKWRGENEWPLARTEYTNYYLHSGGNANTPNGDGSLSTTESSAEESGTDEYDFDPRDPVMSLMRSDSQAAPVDQSPHDHRKDILVYDLPVADEELEVVGPVRLKLWAKTDGPDTDWTAKLSVVYEDGLAVNLTYGIMRAQYRNGYENPELLTPDEIYDYEIKLNPIGCRLKPGQKLRLSVSSSDFPNFDRNHNTGKDYWSDAELRVAHQTIYHDSEHPSHLVLPVIPIS